EEVLETVLGDRRHRLRPSEHAGAMAHRVEAQFDERDALHLVVRRMILYPFLVASKAVARMKHGGMLVGEVGELVETAARELSEPIVVRLEMHLQRGFHVNPEQIAKGAIGAIEICSAAVGSDQVRSGLLPDAGG